MAKAEVVAPIASAALAKVNSMVEDIRQNYLADTSDAFATMASSMLDAETFEAMFDNAGVQPAKDVFGIPFHIENITFNESDYQQGLPVYANFHVKNLRSGESTVINCGAWQTVVAAYKMVKNGWLDKDVMFVESERQTKAGYRPINMVPVTVGYSDGEAF